MSMLKSDCSTLESVDAAVREVIAAAGDDELAHILEDELRALVLKQVGEGHPDSAAMARAALATSALDFSRWCA